MWWVGAGLWSGLTTTFGRQQGGAGQKDIWLCTEFKGHFFSRPVVLNFQPVAVSPGLWDSPWVQKFSGRDLLMLIATASPTANLVDP